jgi:hypothetical protein
LTVAGCAADRLACCVAPVASVAENPLEGLSYVASESTDCAFNIGTGSGSTNVNALVVAGRHDPGVVAIACAPPPPELPVQVFV